MKKLYICYINKKIMNSLSLNIVIDNGGAREKLGSGILCI